MPRPPSTMKGHVTVTTKATYQVKRKHIRHEKKRPRAASTAIAILSVDSPFKALISCVMILVRAPGALVLSSYQPTDLCIKALNNVTLSVYVKFSPPRAKLSF